MPAFHTSEFWPSFSEANIRQFLDGEGDAPAATRGVDTDGLSRTRAAIQSFVDEISALKSADYPCKLAYLDYEQDRLTTLDLIAHADDAGRTGRANDELFGSPEELRYHEALSYLKHQIGALKPAGDSVAEHQARVLEAWGGITAEPAFMERLFARLEADRRALEPFTRGNFAIADELLQPYRAAESMTSAEVAQMLRKAIHRILGADSTWTAQLQDGAPNIFGVSSKHTFFIPTNRTYTLPHARALIVHEIGVHAVRSANGARSHEPLAEYGMAGYSAAEEAMGVLMEHADEAHHDHAQSLIPFSVIDFAGRSRTFRELHELTTSLMVSLANPDDAAYETRLATYRRQAFARVIRMARLGTPRIADRSTTKYWHGLLLLRAYFQDHAINAATLDDFFAGRYNCNAPAQLALIRTHAAQ